MDGVEKKEKMNAIANGGSFHHGGAFIERNSREIGSRRFPA